MRLSRELCPSVLSRHNKGLEWRTLKPPSACHGSRVLDRVISSQVLNGPCNSSQRNQCYSSILFRQEQENPSWRHEGMSTQRREEKSAPACGRERKSERVHACVGGRERALWLLFLCFFPSPGPALCKLGLVRSAVPPEVLNPVLVSSFDLPLFYFRKLFPSLSFNRHFGLLFPILR